MKFHAYVLVEGGTVEFEVEKKIRTDVYGHYTYMLQGFTEKGHKANAVVNKSQWDKFNVPSEERVVEKKLKHVRRSSRLSSMKPSKKNKTPINKHRKKVFNEEIEKWLADHYDIDLEKLDGLS